MTCKLICSGLAAMTLALPAAVVPALASSFDGKWSVVVVTEAGSCDVYKWDLGVADGKIDERGFLARASGRVDRGGAVSVTFSRGLDQLAATGTLAQSDGSGRWHSPTRQCSGRWTAARKS